MTFIWILLMLVNKNQLPHHQKIKNIKMDETQEKIVIDSLGP
jgi:hypothetical protein